ncbi:helix-turn-helix transcriptional regulator [Ornithinimicrobium cerasi]|uniref:helix-turn-helix transcriptional regulator n=1 Tax=Ornithinimicrobium cerasi TaxID=2248773 RepID=UPI00137AB1EF|nr:helix-turn-helix transcriptional regulator [Ornithinimicrobium cerasi]
MRTSYARLRDTATSDVVPLEVVARLVEHLDRRHGHAVLSGARGSGLSTALGCCVAQLRARGHRVHVLPAHVADTGDEARWPELSPGDVLAVDVRHHHHVEFVERAVGAASATGAQVLLVARTGPEWDPVQDVVRTHGGYTFVLRPWSVHQVSQALEARGLRTRDAAEVTTLTGGLPWLLQYVGSRPEDGSPEERADADGPSSGGIGVSVLGLLDGCSSSVADAALALAVGYPAGGRPALPGAAADDAPAQDRLIRSVEAAGFLGSDGTLPPLLRDCLLNHAPAHRVQRWREQLVEDLIRSDQELGAWARDLVRQGVRDPRVVDAFVDQVKALTAITLADGPINDGLRAPGLAEGGREELREAARLLRAVLGAGGQDDAVRLELCRLALCDGDPTRAARELDLLLAAGGPLAPEGILALGLEVIQAVDLPHRAAGLIRWVQHREPAAADHPGVALSRYAAGDLRAGDASVERAAEVADPTASATMLLARGVRTSLHHDPEAALPEFMLAVAAARSTGAPPALADSPAAMVALWGLHAGDLHLVESVADAALRDGGLGPLVRTRLRVLQAFALMQGGRLVEAAEALDDLSHLAPREELWVSALQVGIARRADDPARLRRAWTAARETTLGHPVSLWQLLPLAELGLAAARLREFDLVRPQWQQAARLLAGLREPVLWSTPFHWYGVQIALQRDEPSAAAPHAAALVRAAQEWKVAAVVSSAGRAWVQVRARNVRVDEIEQAARSLSQIGQPWEAARLASHGAAAATVRRDSARLLECARELRPQLAAPADAGAARARDGVRGGRPHDEQRVALQLTERERQVAELLVAGRTYKQVGDILYLSPKTVEHHVARIRRRSGASSRTELFGLLESVVGQRSTGEPAEPS